MKKSLIALAFGTLGLGIAEFVMMGILPDIAKDLHTSIATAGHLISAYALGVCVGAPMLIIARRYPLKHILLVLVGIMMIGNLCAALASNYWVLMIARFISGLPHGAYFGVGSIVAEKLADKGRGSEALYHDSGDDDRQPIRCPVGDGPQHHALVASDFLTGWLLGHSHLILHLEMGTYGREPSGYWL